ncbi:hypothetical protein DFR42_10150 [Undibacterium pigrum]|uniref:Uncharacterized protein n=1 Tax=Undibacterium pigrum TaxID=401470 RepID=A0A318JDC6_9BURK|nr:hypothetical protein DFR42_10150 [Undibacterium pigrum]
MKPILPVKRATQNFASTLRMERFHYFSHIHAKLLAFFHPIKRILFYSYQ